MKPVLIVKTGETYPFISGPYGDFDQMIIQRSGRSNRHFNVCSPFIGDSLPEPAGFSGIIITGSHDMVTDNRDWSRRIEKWVLNVLDKKIPLLGICYGHQLMARAAGGMVGNNPSGMEFGTVNITLSPEASKDSLFNSFPIVFKAQACHTQSVLRLPPKAILLASSAMDRHHAFILGDNAWGVQFHPEFDDHIMRLYIDAFSTALDRQDTGVKGLTETVEPTPKSEDVLKIFVNL